MCFSLPLPKISATHTVRITQSSVQLWCGQQHKPRNSRLSCHVKKGVYIHDWGGWWLHRWIHSSPHTVYLNVCILLCVKHTIFLYWGCKARQMKCFPGAWMSLHTEGNVPCIGHAAPALSTSSECQINHAFFTELWVVWGGCMPAREGICKASKMQGPGKRSLPH